MSNEIKVDKEMDLKGLNCPMPIIKVGQEIQSIEVGQVIHAISTDPGSLSDFPAWAQSTGNEILHTEQKEGEIHFWIKRLS
jgi:tRNA 2-thiouridine synthesizing protein A